MEVSMARLDVKSKENRMAVVKPFPCVRPDKKYAACVAALPYDVYNRKEAKAAASAIFKY